MNKRTSLFYDHFPKLSSPYSDSLRNCSAVSGLKVGVLPSVQEVSLLVEVRDAVVLEVLVRVDDRCGSDTGNILVLEENIESVRIDGFGWVACCRLHM